MRAFVLDGACTTRAVDNKRANLECIHSSITAVATFYIYNDLTAGIPAFVDLSPRLGGLVTIAGPYASIMFFQRNSQGHRRSDFSDLDNGTPKLLRWILDAPFLGIYVEEDE